MREEIHRSEGNRIDCIIITRRRIVNLPIYPGIIIQARLQAVWIKFLHIQVTESPFFSSDSDTDTASETG
jgi:hypothetical protein